MYALSISNKINKKEWHNATNPYFFVEASLLFFLQGAVLGIRDILVRIRIRGSVPLTNGSGSNSGSYFFLQVTLRMQKNNFLYFLITYPQAHYLQSKSFYFLLKILGKKIVFCKHCFSLLSTFMRKGKDPEPDPDPYHCLMDPDPGGPKIMRILQIRIANTEKKLKDMGWTPDAARRSDLCRSLTRPRHHGLSQGGTPLQVGGQVYLCCGFGMFIPDPNIPIPDSGSRVEKILDPHQRI
jgi:hypothetical protein